MPCSLRGSWPININHHIWSRNVKDLNGSRALVQSSRWQCGKSSIIKRGARRSLGVPFALYLGFQCKESSKLERLLRFRKAFVSEQDFGRELSERSVMDPVEFSFQFHLDEGQSFVWWAWELDSRGRDCACLLNLSCDWPRVETRWDLWRKKIWTWWVGRGRPAAGYRLVLWTIWDCYGLLMGQQNSVVSWCLELAPIAGKVLRAPVFAAQYWPSFSIVVPMFVLRCDVLGLSLTISYTRMHLFGFGPSLCFSSCQVSQMWQEIALEVAKRRRGMRFFTAGRPRLAAFPSLQLNNSLIWVLTCIEGSC